MNRKYYQFGNPFKVRFGEHRCLRCGQKLTTLTDRRIVDPHSEEAKYFDFSAGGDGGEMVGACEFIHKVFFCPRCAERTEFVTQLSLEKLMRALRRIEKRLHRQGQTVHLQLLFTDRKGGEMSYCPLGEASGVHGEMSYCPLGEASGVHVDFAFGGKKSRCAVPVMRKNCWERPYYVKVDRRALLSAVSLAAALDGR